MESLAIIIGHSINGIIIALAIITIAGFAYVVMNITKLKASIDEKHKKNRSTEFTPGGIQKTPDAYTWEETLEYKEEYNKIQLIYSTFEQFVPIFPLLGILGTVAGLIQQLDHIDQMRDALAVSMSTTFLGLIAQLKRTSTLVSAMARLNSLWKAQSLLALTKTSKALRKATKLSQAKEA